MGVLVAWLLLVLLTTLMLEPTRMVAVFAPESAAFAALVRSDARLIDVGSGFVLAQGESRGFVRRLYAGGAWLVLPALTGGCRGGLRRQGPARPS
jgi:hypothetical protein